MSVKKNTSLVTAKPQPPSISIVVSFQPRPGQVSLHAHRHAHWQRLYPLARDFAR